MASAIDASASTVQTPTTAAANSNNSIQQLGKDLSQFLTLLTTQLQNQDPLSPLDTNAFTQQLIGFSQVEQQINTNTKLDGLVALGSSNNLSTSLGYVGLNINYLSSEFNFDGSTAVQSPYVLASAAASNKIQVVDSDGNVVYQQTGATDTNNNEFDWNGQETGGGKAPAGTYTLRISALDNAGAAIDSTNTVSGMVRGVETQNGVTNLLVGERAVPLANVINASQPITTATNGSST